MFPQIWSVRAEKAEQKKPVLLALSSADGVATLIAVDEAGNRVATLLTFMDNEVSSSFFAQDALRESGFDTSFAKWGFSGDMLLRQHPTHD